jgi:hypothetical protein
VCPEAEILYELLLIEPGLIINKKKVLKYNRILAKDTKLKLWNIPSEVYINEDKTCFDNFLDILNLFRCIHYPQAGTILFKHNYLINLANQYKLMDCTWINLIRDPRAVFASQRNTISPNTGKPMNRNLLAFADSWNMHMKKILDTQNIENVITLRYEDLVLNTNEVMNALSVQLKLHHRWNDFYNCPAQLAKWISSEYKEIHPCIDDQPESVSLMKWQEQLSKPDLEILQRYVVKNQFYPEIITMEGNRSNRPYILLLRFKRKYLYLRAFAAKRFRNLIAG